MPYIEPKRRAQIDQGTLPETLGELAYKLTRVVEDYRGTKGDSFQTFAEIRAALLSTDDEFAEQVVRPYERIKRQQNGTVHAPLEVELSANFGGRTGRAA